MPNEKYDKLEWKKENAYPNQKKHLPPNNRDVSIIIPTFNQPKRLSLLIKSLEKQTINNFEIIVVDDGSTDNTKEIVDSLIKESPLKISYHYLDNTNIFGAGLARNYGAKKAKGDILIFLDQDCVANPNLVENYLKLHEKHAIILGYYAGYGNNKFHYDFEKLKSRIEKNQKIPIIKEFRRKIFQNPKEYENESWKYFVSANFSIKKDLFMKYQFDKNILQWGGQDIELGYRLIRDNHKPAFSKKCLTYNSSQTPMLNKSKFISSMEVLIYIYKKHNREELKDYCFERFYHTPLNIRGNAELSYKNGRLEFSPPEKYAFIRIDDVYKKDGNLLEILDFITKDSIPINLQLIPDLLEQDLVDYLNELKQKFPHLISINQHGFNHINHGSKEDNKFEFGDKRSYEDQKKDIFEGHKILYNKFGNDFNKIFTPPYYGYDENTIKILEELNFNMISLGKEKKFNHRSLINLQGNLDLIKEYNPLKYFSEEELNNKLDLIDEKKEYLGIVLHPQKSNPQELNKLKKLTNLSRKKGYEFIFMGNIKEKQFERTRTYIDRKNIAHIEAGRDADRLKEEIKNLPPLTKNINFNLRIIKNLGNESFQYYREKFLEIIKFLRDNKISINLDDIRLQSIKYDRFLIGPKTLQINVYDYCNYNCKFCFTHSELMDSTTRDQLEKELYAPSKDYINFQKVKGMIDEAYSMGVETIRFCGNGEPFLNKDITKIIKYTSSLGLKIVILTNLMRGESLLDLNKNSKISLVVNLAASSPEEFETIHDQNPEKFKYLLNLIKKVNKKFPVTLSYIITNENYKSTLDYLKIANKLGIHFVEFKNPVLYFSRLKTLLLSNEQREELKKQIPSLTEFAKSKSIRTNLHSLKNTLQDEGFTKNNNIMDHTPELNKCYNSWYFNKITTNGLVCMCCKDTTPIAYDAYSKNLKEIFFSEDSQSRGLEGKRGIDVEKKEWHKCRSCPEYELNKRVENSMEDI